MSDVVVFDLDDTLYYESDFVKSGFNAIATRLGNRKIAEELTNIWLSGGNAFKLIIEKHELSYSVDQLLEIYRCHIPQINLDIQTNEVFDWLINNNCMLGIITDGRSITQRNKISSLNLERWIPIENIIISEEFGSAKPDVRNYRFFMDKYPESKYVYIGDNPAKDFVTPNKLGWLTIGLRDIGYNIHQQLPNSKDYEPHIWIDNIFDLKSILNSSLKNYSKAKRHLPPSQRVL